MYIIFQNLLDVSRQERDIVTCIAFVLSSVNPGFSIKSKSFLVMRREDFLVC